LGIVLRPLSRQERAGARELHFHAGLIIFSKLQDETHATVTTQRVAVETVSTECSNLFGQPSRHAASIARSFSMHTSQSVGKSAHSSPDSRHPGGVGERPSSAPLAPRFSPTRSLESAWPPLYSIKSCSWSRTSHNWRSSRCRRSSGRVAGANSGDGASGVTGTFEDHHGL
jgi:hypothetical protein